MRRILAALTGATAVMLTAMVAAPSSNAQHLPRGAADTFAHIMKLDDVDLTWWNHLAQTNDGSHAWRVWENASAPLAQDNAKIASRLLGYTWPAKVADDVHTVIVGKINEGAAWADVTEAAARHKNRDWHLANDRTAKYNRRAWRAEMRVRDAFHLNTRG